MNSVRVKVHIPKPCFENWEAMLPAEKGRFCLNCQKTVVDFSQKSSEEILSYISSHTNICGRFHDSQVLQPHELPKPFFHRWKEYLITTALVLGTKLAAITPVTAQTSRGATTEISPQEKETKQPIFNADGNLYLKGVVLNEIDGQPLEGVLVSVILQNGRLDFRSEGYYRNSECTNSESSPYKTTTDKSGKFKLIIPVVELGESINRLNFKLNGFVNAERPLHYSEVQKPIIQYLRKPDPAATGNVSHYASGYTAGTLPSGGVKYLVVPDLRGDNPYKTRAGIILSKGKYPYYWVKNLLTNSR